MKIIALVFIALVQAAFISRAAPVHLVDESPVKVSTVAPGVVLVDFGRAAFGNLRFLRPPNSKKPVIVHFGEAVKKGRIDREPPGTVRYAVAKLELNGSAPIVAAPPADKRNTEVNATNHPPAILTPAEYGVVLPFRWVEIEGWPGELKSGDLVRQSLFSATWDEDAAAFESSDEMLNRIWDLCQYSIKATTFAGVYVDGDRERIPYEADAYLNQLSHYTTDNDIQIARDTIDHLMKYPTWPTEWAPHMVLMAYADWMHTGDAEWLAPRYESFKAKMLLERVGPDGLVTSDAEQVKKTDIVDWPKGERDRYVFTAANTVVNAFHLRALACMAKMAKGLGEDADAAEYSARARATHAVFQKTFFDAERGIYRDGVGTDHSSQHANFFPLAFGLVPAADRERVTDWVASRGMRCSVYAAQYLLDALFENGAATEAMELITAPTDRSWRHMVESGTTITWEAWDQKYKPNQDWNHAWGAAPANLLPRYVIGVQPLTPGWKTASIRPHPSGLESAEGKVPTPLGPVFVSWQNGDSFRFDVKLPAGMNAKVDLPATASSKGVFLNGKQVDATRAGDRWILDEQISGSADLLVK